MRVIAFSVGSITLAFVLLLAVPLNNQAQIPASTKLVADSAILNGLEAGALFPFIDSTPNEITRTHIAVTDATSNCFAGAAAPFNIQVLVGVAGGTLVNVVTAATNTGIGSTSQCVFHVTVTPGAGGVPSEITDIVVRNSGASSLTGANTITVSAEIR
jgi:hypothetical protein